MSELIGYVNKIAPKSGTSKAGRQYTVYNVLFTEKESGEETWVGWGFDAPAFQEGQWVKTTVEANGKYLNYKGAPVKVADGPAPNTKETGGTGGGSKDQSIWYQNSRTAAVATVAILKDLDALPISSAAGKAGQAKRYEQTLDIIEKITVQYFHDVETLRLLDKVADAGEVEVPKTEPIPEAPEEPAAEEEDDGEDWL